MTAEHVDHTPYLLVQAYQRLWLVKNNDSYGNSHMLSISFFLVPYQLDAARS